MRMFVGGEWKETSNVIEVINPFDQSVVDTVPAAESSDVDEALAGAVEGAKIMAKIPAYDRAQMLRKTAESHAGTLRGLCPDHQQRRRKDPGRGPFRGDPRGRNHLPLR